jgi:hypothetical protein
MDGAVNPAWIAITVSIGGSVLAGLMGMFVGMTSREGSAIHRDAVVPTLFGIAMLLILSNVIAAALIAAGGMAYVGLLKAALLASAVFAIMCIGIALRRGYRRDIL